MKIFLFLLQCAALLPYLLTIDTIINNNGKDFLLPSWGWTTGQARSLRLNILECLLMRGWNIFFWNYRFLKINRHELCAPCTAFPGSRVSFNHPGTRTTKVRNSLERISSAGVSLGQLFGLVPRKMCKTFAGFMKGQLIRARWTKGPESRWPDGHSNPLMFQIRCQTLMTLFIIAIAIKLLLRPYRLRHGVAVSLLWAQGKWPVVHFMVVFLFPVRLFSTRIRPDVIKNRKTLFMLAVWGWSERSERVCDNHKWTVGEVFRIICRQVSYLPSRKE